MTKSSIGLATIPSAYLKLVFLTALSSLSSPGGCTYGKDRVNPWMGPRFIAEPHVSICGFGTLLKGTLAVFWHFPLIPEDLTCFVGTSAYTENPPLLRPVPNRRSYIKHQGQSYQCRL